MGWCVSGCWGVLNSKGGILHFGTLPQYIDKLGCELLTWAKKSDLHRLIKGCVFHYEFELIHPFSDGNGRMGRLWHTLLLSKWNPIFAWLPVETIIHDRQQEYYDAINRSNSEGKSTVFIHFMLSAIKEALKQSMESGDTVTKKPSTAKNNKNEYRWNVIFAFLQEHSIITNGDVQQLLAVSPATANRVLNDLVAQKKLVRIRQNSHWAYKRP